MNARVRRSDVAWSALLAVVILGPAVFGRGFVLRGDMVFVPFQPWKAAWVGADGSVPRSVPMDAVVSALTHVLPGEVVQRGFLLGALLLGAVGAARLVSAYRFPARAAAALLFVWNPWVYERLAIGQWGLVLGLACLVWLVPAAVAMRDDPRREWPALALWLAAAAATLPSMGLMATVTAAAVVASGRRVVPVLAVLGGGALANLPWIVPSLLVPGGITSADGQFAAFAARGESSLGLVPSLLSLGGIWKTSVVPAERTEPLLLALAAVTTVAALWGLRRQRAVDRPALVALGAVAVFSVVLAALPAVPGVAGMLDRLDGSVPGLAMLRDSHRYLAPAVLVLLPGLAAAVDELFARARPGREALRVVAVLLVAWPVLSLPGMAWGLAGKLDPSPYPREWQAVADILEQHQPATTVVLPWRGSYRGFDWNRRTAVLDPATRFFAGEVLVDDRLYLGDRTLRSEDDFLRRVGDAVRPEVDAAALRDLGVRFVVDHPTQGVPRTIPGRVLHDGSELRLADLGASGAPGRDRPPRAPVVVAYVLWAALLLGSGLVRIATRVR